jgi:catalase
LLAGRIHSYVDTQITRLGGPNFHEIPINAPIAPVHNNQRDGFHRQAIPRGRVAYEPNSLGGGCPFQAGAKGFVSFPQPIQDDKVRGKPEKFAEHYNQATLFFNSQTEVEKAHIIAAFRFELSKLTVPAIRERMVASLRNVSEDLASRVADGLGIELPEPLPKALDEAPQPEVTVSPALSLRALPGEVGIRTRKVAILVANGMEGESIAAVHKALLDQGALPRLVGSRLGQVQAVDGKTRFEADASLENTPAVLFDALVLPCGQDAVDALARDGHTLEFIKDQYRHCKPILALGLSQQLLDKAGIPATLPSGDPDEALIRVPPSQVGGGLEAFIGALAQHRYTPRDSDPPLV